MDTLIAGIYIPSFWVGFAAGFFAAVGVVLVLAFVLNRGDKP